MRSSVTRFAAYACGVLGFSAMAWAGWALGSHASTPTARPEARIQGTGRSPRSAVSEEVRRKLSPIRQAASPEERMRATLELARNLPASEIPAWMKGHWFDVDDGYEFTLFNNILRERWKAEDPGGLIAWDLKDKPPSLTGMFAANTLSAWAAKDPQQAFDFLRERMEPGMAFRTLGELAQRNPELAAKGLREIAGGAVNDGDTSPVSELLDTLAAKAPGTLEELLDGLPPPMRSKAEKALVEARLTGNFAGELANLANRPDGLKIFQSALSGRPTLGDRVLENLANIPASWRQAVASEASSFVSSAPRKWLNVDLEAAGFSSQEAQRIRSSAVMHVAYHEPQEALRLLDSLGLTADERESIVRSIGRFAKNVEANEAGEKKRPEVAGQPADWLRQVVAISPESNDQWVYYSELGQWDASRIAELSKQFDSLPEAQKTVVATNLARAGSIRHPELTGKAIEHMITVSIDPESRRQGGEGNPVQFASNHAVRWLKNDPRAASDWVNHLPAGEAKTWAQKNVAAQWLKCDFEEAQHWINALPAGERKEVEAFVGKDAEKFRR